MKLILLLLFIPFGLNAECIFNKETRVNNCYPENNESSDERWDYVEPPNSKLETKMIDEKIVKQKIPERKRKVKKDIKNNPSRSSR